MENSHCQIRLSFIQALISKIWSPSPAIKQLYSFIKDNRDKPIAWLFILIHMNELFQLRSQGFIDGGVYRLDPWQYGKVININVPYPRTSYPQTVCYVGGSRKLELWGSPSDEDCYLVWGPNGYIYGNQLSRLDYWVIGQSSLDQLAFKVYSVL